MNWSVEEQFQSWKDLSLYQVLQFMWSVSGMIIKIATCCRTVDKPVFSKCILDFGDKKFRAVFMPSATFRLIGDFFVLRKKWTAEYDEHALKGKYWRLIWTLISMSSITKGVRFWGNLSLSSSMLMKTQLKVGSIIHQHFSSKQSNEKRSSVINFNPLDRVEFNKNQLKTLNGKEWMFNWLRQVTFGSRNEENADMIDVTKRTHIIIFEKYCMRIS